MVRINEKDNSSILYEATVTIVVTTIYLAFAKKNQQQQTNRKYLTQKRHFVLGI